MNDMPMKGGMPPAGGASAGGPSDQGGEGGMDAGNPVVEAIQTLAKFIAAQAEKGAPNSGAMQAWLKKGIEILTGGQGGPENPEEQQGENPGEENQPQEMSRDINAGKGSARVL